MANIVVAEDNRLVAYSLVSALEIEGHKVSEACVLEEILSAIRRSDLLVLSDTVKGYEEIAEKVNGSIPIILLSAYEQKEYEHCIIKPYFEEDLLVKVGKVLKELEK